MTDTANLKVWGSLRLVPIILIAIIFAVIIVHIYLVEFMQMEKKLEAGESIDDLIPWVLTYTLVMVIYII